MYLYFNTNKQCKQQAECADYSHLPPEQRKRKLQSIMDKLHQAIDNKEKEKFVKYIFSNCSYIIYTQMYTDTLCICIFRETRVFLWIYYRHI